MLRYEARLKMCKQVAKFGNFKNICLFIAQKNQRGLCWQLQSALYLSEKLEVGGVSKHVSFAVAIKHLISGKEIEISEEGVILILHGFDTLTVRIRKTALLLLICWINLFLAK